MHCFDFKHRNSTMSSRSQRALGLVAFLYIAIIFLPLNTYCEHTSVDELASWSHEMTKIINQLNEQLELQEKKVLELRRARDSLLPLHQEMQKKALIDPVHIFVVLNRLKSTYNIAKEHLQFHIPDDDDNIMQSEDVEDTNNFSSYAREDSFLARLQEDLEGSGTALLRLHEFYGLNHTHLVNGSVLMNGSTTFKMTANDCFELGLIAYRNQHYSASLLWHHSALELSIKVPGSDNYDIELVKRIFDHMSFASYKLGQLEYAARLTRAWLEQDPDNERALENLEYYVEELSSIESSSRNGSEHYNKNTEPATNIGGELSCLSEEDPFPEKLNLANYDNLKDETVRRLCRQTNFPSKARHKCYKGTRIFAKGLLELEVKLEILSEQPQIMRIYDIVSLEEAEHLQRLARPELQRSTILRSGKQMTSDFRIAKTAWLSGDSDIVVKRIEDRLEAILDIRMEDSERLQVVNYGIGGFYGPHLDSARPSKLSLNNSNLAEQFESNDRYATIMIYLNDVEVGGSTVFPLIDLAVNPVGRSAVVWFNILTNGYSDERTLHTGCPVSLGSKWIAVKWPREAANTFSRKRQWWRQEFLKKGDISQDLHPT